MHKISFCSDYSKKAIRVFLVSSAFLLLIIPDLIPINDSTISYSEQLGLGLFFWLAWFSIFKRVWLGFALAVPIALFSTFSIYLRWQYQVPINPVFAGMVLDTNLNEFVNFASVYVGWLIIAISLPVSIMGSGIYVAYKTQLNWTHWSRWVAIPILPLYILTMQAQENLLKVDDVLAKKVSEHPLEQRDDVAVIEKLRLVYPYELATSVQQVIQDTKKISRIRNIFKGYVFHATVDDRLAPEIVVFVIGESARADRWHIFGYERQTTPNLEQEKNLIGFSNVVTPSTATRYAVPNLVSSRPLFKADGSQNINPEPSFLKIMSEVGYHTYWLSNQSKAGYYDGPIDLYARDADVTQYFNIASYSEQGRYDEDLLKPFADLMSNKQKTAVVLHLMGSHFNYAYRYPQQFNVFTPSLTNSSYSRIRTKPEMTISSRELSNNAYDNSILYTDFVLSQIIQTIKRTNKSAVLVYVSDHGEDIFEPECEHPTISRTSKHSYHVPAFVWMSDQQKVRDEEAYTQLKLMRDSELESADFGRGFVALAHINRLQIDQRNWVDRSQDRRVFKRRIYAAGHWVDYDALAKKYVCLIK